MVKERTKTDRHIMKNCRIHGEKPYTTAVIHGGPGAPGEVAPVAAELAEATGVLEPFQTADSVDGQIQELLGVLKKHAAVPVVLIGHSWGAWLSFMTAARHPGLVKKLVLVSCPPFEQKYADCIFPERMNRLSEDERIEVLQLIDRIEKPGCLDKNKALARIAELYSKADSYDPLPQQKNEFEFSEEINRKVMAETAALRESGKLSALGREIACHVTAIHGDYDPHPAEGVQEPLSRILKDFRFILLENCGHYPWLERFAGDRFYDILKKEIRRA